MIFSQIVQFAIRLVVLPGFLGLLMVSHSSCGDKKQGLDHNVLARVNDEYLLRSDLQAIFPDYQTPSDSAMLVQKFIQDWVSRRVFLENAIKNLKVPLTEFEEQVNQYRTALLVHAYENQLVEEHLDTVITRIQLAEFFEKVKDNFRLKEDIVRARFVKFPVEVSSGISEFRLLIQSTKANDLAALEDFCINNSVAFYLDVNRWLSLSDLIRDLPAQNSNHENFLRNNFLVELKDDSYKYFVYILDHRKLGSIAPLSFEEDNVRNLILMQRKRELINTKRNQFLLEAKDRNMVEY